MRIVCLTEESVEFFYRLGRPEVVVGVSVYAVRPKTLPNAQTLPRVSAFTHANIKKIAELKPDLIIGYSDVQKEIAKELTDMGLPILITHQRSIEEIFKSLALFGNLIGEKDKTEKLIAELKSQMQEIIDEVKCLTNRLERPIKVYFEEWDEPRIAASQWIHELLSLLGAKSLGFEKASESHKSMHRGLSDEEIIAFNPDIILYAWCGKKGDNEKIFNRPGYDKVKAISSGNVHEISSDIILQPGIAALTDGVKILKDHLLSVK